MVSVFEGFTENTRKKGVIDLLVTQSKTDVGYFFLLSVASLITTLGLTIDRPSVVIGGMLIAPLLSPILALGLALTTISMKAVLRSTMGIFGSVSVVVFWSFVVSLFVHSENYLTAEMLVRGSYTNYYLAIAFLSGLGATYAWIEPIISSALPGVAVAVSLLPPLCVSGIALAQKNWELFLNSSKIFCANIIGIIFASIILFLLFRFSKFKRFQEKRIDKVDEPLASKTK